MDNSSEIHPSRGYLAIPRKVSAPVSLGLVRRNSYPSELSSTLGIKSFEFEHMMAFRYCLSKMDRAVRLTSPDEKWIIISEDHPTMKAHLRATHETIMADPITLPPEMLQGPPNQSGTLRIERSIDQVHFVKKGKAPLLDIADVCAFSFNRYFNDKKDGDRLVRALLGGLPDKSHWTGLGSAATWGLPDGSVREVLQNPLRM